jgi:hypothetical protein
MVGLEAARLPGYSAFSIRKEIRMKAMLTVLIASALTLAMPAASLAQMNSQAATVTVTLKAQNGSGEDGTATLTQQGSDLVVTISVANGTSTPQPAHIHTGTCANLGGVKYPLTNVVNGKSTTTVKGLQLSSIQTGGFAINIHKSAADLATYTSCGGIPKA